MKLSIITINYNNLEGLKRTYDSVVAQTCQDFEWIIIDGGSTDGSKEFIEEHQEHFAYWCSEPDKGIYNAMNKGIMKATGVYLQFLNSGDRLVDEKVTNDFLCLEKDEDVISGDIIRDGNMEAISPNPDEDNLDFDIFLHSNISHQPSFICKELFERYGMYDEKLKVVSDWKFFTNVLMIQGCSYWHWHRVVADYKTGGISSPQGNYEVHMKERKKELDRYRRIIRSIEKRDKRIKELDLPVMVILRRKAIAKVKRLLGFN